MLDLEQLARLCREMLLDISETPPYIASGNRRLGVLEMSIARPSRCVLCLFRRSARTPSVQVRRSLHSTPNRRKDEGDSGAPDIVDIPEQGRASQKIDRKEWKKQYEPRQVEAIEAAKELIGDKFEEGKSIPRTDPWSVDYYDDFQNIDPMVDLPIRAPWENLDDDMKLRSGDDAGAELNQYLEHESPEDESGDPHTLKYIKYMDSMRLTTGRKEAELDPPSALMPTLPSPAKVVEPGKIGMGDKGRRISERDSSPEMIRLLQMTGMSLREISALRVKTIVTRRVANQTRLGKIYKMSFLSIAGNENGLLGIGEGKADDPTSARIQSQYRAIRSMQPIKRYEKRTIFGTVNAKVGATELELYARPPGMCLTFLIPAPPLTATRIRSALPESDLGNGQLCRPL